MGDGRSWTMSWIDIIVWQGEELSFDTMEELLRITSWEVRPSDGFTEQSITCQDQMSLWKDDRNTTDRMSWCWQDSETKFPQLVFFVKDKSVFCRFCDHICHIIVARKPREIIDGSIEPAGLALCNIDWRIAKSLANQVQTHDMVIMGVGQENSTNRFVDILDGLTNSFPMATGIDNDEVLFAFQIIGIFIGNRIHSFMDFHISSNLKECTNTLRKSLQTASTLSATSKQCFEQHAASFLVCSLIFIEYKLSIAQLGRIKQTESSSLQKVTCYLLHSV